MAKKVTSFTIHKKKPMKHTKRKKLRAIFKNIVDYMKSDTYMFAPLLSPQYSLPVLPTSAGGVEYEPVKKKQKKLVQELEDYLKSDAYMYAPLVQFSDSDMATSISKDTGGPSQLIGQQPEKTTQPSTVSEDGLEESQHTSSERSPAPAATKRVIIQHETVKRVVHQNCRSSAVPGKRLVKEPSKTVK